MISPTAVLDLKASFFRFVQLTPGYSDQARAISAQSLGMTNMIHAPTVPDSVIPNINIGGFTGPLFGSGSFSWSPYNRWILSPSLSLTKGAHSLHFGFEYNYESRGNNNPQRLRHSSPSPQLGRSKPRTAPSTARCRTAHGALGIASLLLGMPTSGSIDNKHQLLTSAGPTMILRAGRLEGQQAPDRERRPPLRVPAHLPGTLTGWLPVRHQHQEPAERSDPGVWRANKTAYDATNPKYLSWRRLRR